MSKENLSFRIPNDILNDIERIQEQEGIEERSEAARRVVRRGIKQSKRRQTAGEQLFEAGTGVAAVGAVMSSISVVFGQSWAMGLVGPFWATTVLFALMWGAIVALRGRDLL